RHDLDLVRQGQVAAARIRCALEEGDQFLQRRVLGLDRQASVVAVDVVLLQPEAGQRRRARMLDPPADDAGEGPAVRFGEQLIVGRTAAFSSPMQGSDRKASSGKSGKPRTVK